MSDEHSVIFSSRGVSVSDRQQSDLVPGARGVRRHPNNDVNTQPRYPLFVGKYCSFNVAMTISPLINVRFIRHFDKANMTRGPLV